MAPTEGKRAITGVPQEDNDDVVITKETYKGKELVVVDKPTAPYIRNGHFRFMDLPAELRVHVFSFLLPYHQVIQHALITKNDKDHWHVWATPKLTDTTQRPTKRAFRKNGIKVESQLFLINKAVSNDALSVLYGCNTYKFTVNGQAHHPKSMQSPQIFGHFSDCKNGLNRLRDLRSIRIEVLLDVRDYWAAKRQRARLEYFVSVLKEYADDEDKKSLLQELIVDFVVPQQFHDRVIVFTGPARLRDFQNANKFIFGLESLAALRGIKNVIISGVPEWYKQCLTLCVQNEGGDVKDMEWPEVVVTRKKLNYYMYGSNKPYQTWVTTRKWWQPLLNWKEFAGRNGIEIPEEFKEYWKVVDQKALVREEGGGDAE